MANIKQEHWVFYLQGRQTKRLPRIDLDEAALAKEILAAGRATPLSMIHEACSKALSHMAVGRKRREWVAANAIGIADAGGDDAGCYAAWLAGVTDELAYGIEEEVVAEMALVIQGDAVPEDSDEDEDADDEGDDDDEDEDANSDDDEEEDVLPPHAHRGRR